MDHRKHKKLQDVVALVTIVGTMATFVAGVNGLIVALIGAVLVILLVRFVSWEVLLWPLLFLFTHTPRPKDARYATYRGQEPISPSYPSEPKSAIVEKVTLKPQGTAVRRNRATSRLLADAAVRRHRASTHTRETEDR